MIQYLLFHRYPHYARITNAQKALNKEHLFVHASEKLLFIFSSAFILFFFYAVLITRARII